MKQKLSEFHQKLEQKYNEINSIYTDGLVDGIAPLSWAQLLLTSTGS